MSHMHVPRFTHDIPNRDLCKPMDTLLHTALIVIRYQCNVGNKAFPHNRIPFLTFSFLYRFTLNTAHVMPLSPGSDITTFHGQDKNRISNLTKEIIEVAQELVATRDDCAKELSNTGQFELALKEAAIIQALEPASSVGYLRAADVYQAQGSPQEAVVVCKKGLEIVPPSDPGYTNLKTVHMHAMESSTKRIDFLTQLPADIVATYIIPLLLEKVRWDSSTGCSYLYVCQRWRQLMLECNLLEFQITFYKAYVTEKEVSELMKFAPHVKAIWMKDYCNQITSTHSSVILHGRFSNLKTWFYTGMCFQKDINVY